MLVAPAMLAVRAIAQLRVVTVTVEGATSTAQRRAVVLLTSAATPASLLNRHSMARGFFHPPSLLPGCSLAMLQSTWVVASLVSRGIASPLPRRRWLQRPLRTSLCPLRPVVAVTSYSRSDCRHHPPVQVHQRSEAASGDEGQLRMAVRRPAHGQRRTQAAIERCKRQTATCRLHQHLHQHLCLCPPFRWLTLNRVILVPLLQEAEAAQL